MTAAPRKAIALIVACGALAGAAGCGGGDDMDESAATATTTTTAAAGAEASSADRIGIADFKYDPDVVTVAVGTKVTWTNSDAAPHTATADDSSFDTGDLDKGDSGAVTFDEPGTFSYYCRFHPFMKATVQVQ
jgi:plastocyanin